MSIIKRPTYNETGRGFDLPGNNIQNIAGLFFVKKNFTVTVAQLSDSDYLFSIFNNKEIFPLHLVQDVISKDEELVKRKSLQNFDYEIQKGKYKNTFRFDFSPEFHDIIQTYSGTDVSVIFYDAGGNIILTELSNGIYGGIKTDSVILHKQKLFGNGSNFVYSDLDIELKLNESIKVIPVDWELEKIDKLFIKLEILLTSVAQLNFIAKYNSINIDTLTISDISIIDDLNGEMLGALLSYNGGIYSASNFSKPLTTGCLIINAVAYLGQQKYRPITIIETYNNFIFEDGNNFIFEDGNNYIFEN